MNPPSALCLQCRSFGYPNADPPVCFLCNSQMVLIADEASERVIWNFLQAVRTDLPPETAAMSVAERELESLRRSMSTARTMFAQALRRHGMPTCSDGEPWDHQFLSCIADHVDQALTKDRERIAELEAAAFKERAAVVAYLRDRATAADYHNLDADDLADDIERGDHLEVK